MYFQQFYLTCLSHASYMLGSEGVACVVDPQRDVSLYLDEAEAQGLKIQHIIETHLHADFVSGHVELAARTGAKIYIGAAVDSPIPHVAVHDGDEIRFGRVILRFLETPGHTVESVSVAVTDLDRGEKPWAVLTGDTLFIGDVGRPDLSKDKTPQELAGMLYDSLHRKLIPLGDDVEVYPAHGAGSLCGKQMRQERQSTIGKERELNYALRAASKEEFVRLLTAELPEVPTYFAQDAELNRIGAIPLEFLAPMEALAPDQLLAKQRAGCVILDTRAATEFGSAHIPGSVNIPLRGQFAGSAGALLRLENEVVLVAEDQAEVEESRTRLARVGFENVTGYLAGGIASWVEAQKPVAQVLQITAAELDHELAQDPGSIQIVDVRRKPEWEHGHIPGARHMPLDRMAKMLDDLDHAKPVVVHCQGGYRSAIGCSLVERAGFANVTNLIGGMDAWQATGLPVTEEIRT